MALAALEKTWQYDVNRVQAATGAVLTTHRQIIRGIKNRLLAFSTLPWTVRYSCDSSVAGLAGDGVDRWSADASLVWATGDVTGARSWIVLRNTDGCELLLECRNTVTTSGKALRIVFSPAAGFTGGSVAGRPTATDEVLITSGDAAVSSVGFGQPSNTTDRAYAYHLLHSTDGLVTMVVICHNGNAVGFWYIGRLSQPVSGFTKPVLCAVWGDSAATPVEGPSIGLLLEGQNSDATNLHCGFRHGSTNGKGYAVCEAFGSGTANSAEPTTRQIVVANEITSQWQLPQVGIASLTSGLRGVHGRLFDVSWAPEVRATGERYPSAAPFTGAVMGDVLIPWNNTAVVAA